MKPFTLSFDQNGFVVRCPKCKSKNVMLSTNKKMTSGTISCMSCDYTISSRNIARNIIDGQISIEEYLENEI